MTYVLCLPPNQWPEPERQIWQEAIQKPKGLKRPSPASTWSPARQRIVAQALGQWFSWLDRTGYLGSELEPGARLSEARMVEFAEQLLERVSSVSTSMMMGAIKRGYDVLAPGGDRKWLASLCTALKSHARPSRNRLAHLVAPVQILNLGLRLMEEAQERDENRTHLTSCMARDGLMLAMLTCFPVRIANFSSIEIGRHLIYQHDRYMVHFPASETKTGRAEEGEYPPSLTRWINWYLETHRLRLMAGTLKAGTALWINRWGGRLASHSVRTQIETRTQKEFGRHVWPHLFRGIAVTGLVDLAPEHVALGSELLGHASIGTTEKHYVLARGAMAHRAFHSCLNEARVEAMARLAGCPDRISGG